MSLRRFRQRRKIDDVAVKIVGYDVYLYYIYVVPKGRVEHCIGVWCTCHVIFSVVLICLYFCCLFIVRLEAYVIE